MLKLSIILVLAAVATLVTCDKRQYKTSNSVSLLSKTSETVALKRFSQIQGKYSFYLVWSLWANPYNKFCL